MNKLQPTRPPNGADSKSRIADEIGQLALYRNYKRAFCEATGLPLTLVQPGMAESAQSETACRNPFCKLISTHGRTCAACRQSRRKLTPADGSAPLTSKCFAGLCESSVPIRNGSKTIGYLLTGQVATSKPTLDGFLHVLSQLEELGVRVDEVELRRTYFATPVIAPEKYRSLLDLLAIFAGHLSLVAGQLAFHDHDSTAPNITRARKFIEENLADPLDLKTVAEHAHMSSCYFCKRFKESTGFTFTGYMSRIRVEAAKNRLINPQVRISEVAYEVGFQSLTHFNRVFKEIVGRSPTRYRKELPGAELRAGRSSGYRANHR